VHLGGPVATQAAAAFTDGLHVALLVGAGAAVAAAIVVALLLRRGGPAQP
jgi:hypothetical protein